MNKVKGCKITAYLTPEASEAYVRLSAFAEDIGISVSSLMSEAVINEYMRRLAGVKVSAGAYGCLRNKDLEGLQFDMLEPAPGIADMMCVTSREDRRQDAMVKKMLSNFALLGTGEVDSIGKEIMKI